MLDPADIAAFLVRYLEACDQAGIDPLPVPELAALLAYLSPDVPDEGARK